MGDRNEWKPECKWKIVWVWDGTGEGRSFCRDEIMRSFLRWNDNNKMVLKKRDRTWTGILPLSSVVSSFDKGNEWTLKFQKCRQIVVQLNGYHFLKGSSVKLYMYMQYYYVEYTVLSHFMRGIRSWRTCKIQDKFSHSKKKKKAKLSL
jgi:hypothetical protein